MTPQDQPVKVNHEQAKLDRAAEFAEMMLERDREQLELEAQCNRRLTKQREYNRRKWDPNYRAPR